MNSSVLRTDLPHLDRSQLVMLLQIIIVSNSVIKSNAFTLKSELRTLNLIR